MSSLPGQHCPVLADIHREGKQATAAVSTDKDSRAGDSGRMLSQEGLIRILLIGHPWGTTLESQPAALPALQAGLREEKHTGTALDNLLQSPRMKPPRPTRSQRMT